MKFSIHPRHNKGFTLLELIVAIGLFVISIFISFGSLVGMFDANSKSQTIFSAMTNLNYSIEGMTRDIRFSTTYHCDITSGPITSPRDCSGGSDTLAVTSGSGTIIYRWNGVKIEKSLDGTNYIPVTGTDVTIDYGRFYVAGSAPSTYPVGTVGRDIQPYVIILLKGYSGALSSNKTTFDLETMVSKKQLDL